MKDVRSAPFANSKLARFLRRRILELRPTKTQIAIAAEVGWKSCNVLSMIAGGTTKLPVDRVPALAKALDVDAAYLLRLALQQHDNLLWDVVEDAAGTVLTANEKKIIAFVRSASSDTDPAPTGKFLRALRDVFGA